MIINEYPLVSIIIPVYGVERYIEKFAKTIFSQDYPNIEYIFVDDCTNDDSIVKVKAAIANHPHVCDRVKILRHPENRGLPQARKTGFEESKGDYIIHVDPDDWVEPTYISQLLETAIRSGADITWCDYFVEEEQGNAKVVETNFAEYSKHDIIMKLLSGEFHSAVWNKMVTRRTYNTETVFSIYNQLEDLYLTTQLMLNAHKLSHVGCPLYHYRVNANSLSFSNARIKKRCFEEYQNFKSVFHFIEDAGYDMLSFEPVLSNRVNALKLAFMKYKENRNFDDVKNFYPDSIKNLFSLDAPLRAKLKLYLSVKTNSDFLFKL